MKKTIVNFMLKLFAKRQKRVVHNANGDTFGECVDFDYCDYTTSKNLYITFYISCLGVTFAKTLTPELYQFSTVLFSKFFGFKVKEKKNEQTIRN